MLRGYVGAPPLPGSKAWRVVGCALSRICTLGQWGSHDHVLHLSVWLRPFTGQWRPSGLVPWHSLLHLRTLAKAQGATYSYPPILSRIRHERLQIEPFLVIHHPSVRFARHASPHLLGDNSDSGTLWEGPCADLDICPAYLLPPRTR